MYLHLYFRRVVNLPETSFPVLYCSLSINGWSSASTTCHVATNRMTVLMSNTIFCSERKEQSQRDQTEHFEIIIIFIYFFIYLFIYFFYLFFFLVSSENRLWQFVNLSISSRKHTYIILTPLKPHFYMVKLGFTGLYIIFLILLKKNIGCGYSLEPPRRGGSNEYPQSMFWTEIWKLSIFFIWKFSLFWL